MPMYEVWCEGYRTNGESSEAFLLGTFEAKCFDDAVLKCMKNSKDQYLFTYTLTGNNHMYWGCRIFDNEKDARKSFG